MYSSSNKKLEHRVLLLQGETVKNMEFIYFTLAGIVLYLAADWVLLRIEAMRGSLLPNRSLFFFGIISILAILLFQTIQLFAPPDMPQGENGPKLFVEQPVSVN